MYSLSFLLLLRARVQLLQNLNCFIVILNGIFFLQPNKSNCAIRSIAYVDGLFVPGSLFVHLLLVGVATTGGLLQAGIFNGMDYQNKKSSSPGRNLF